MSASRILFALSATAKSLVVTAAEYVATVDYGALALDAYTFAEETDLSFRLAATAAAAAPSTGVPGIVDEGFDPYRLMFMFGVILGAYSGYRHRQYVKAEEQRIAADAARRLGAQDQIAADYAFAQQIDAEESDSDEASSESSSAAENSDVDVADENNSGTPNHFAQRLEIIAYTGDIPQLYKCILSLDIVHDPVVADDGKTYEKGQLKAYFATREANQLPIVSPANHDLKMGKNMMRVGAFKSQVEGFVRSEELKYLKGAIQSIRTMFFRNAKGEPADEKSVVVNVKSGEATRLIIDYMGLRR